MPPAMPAIANPSTRPGDDRHRPGAAEAKSLQRLALRRSIRRGRRPDRRASGSMGSWSPWSSRHPGRSRGPGRSSPDTVDCLRGPWGWPKSPARSAACRAATARRTAVLEYNRQRRKTFSQLMREADAPRGTLGRPRPAPVGWPTSAGVATDAPDSSDDADCRNSDDRGDEADSGADAGEADPSRRSRARGRTDAAIARHLGMGGKDLYRQARAIWRLARSGDARAQSGVPQLDGGTKTIHAAYKDLRRRDRFGSDFRPTPYDVWSFRHDRAFGIPHPGSIPPALVAHSSTTTPPRRPGRQPDGRRRDHARRLPVDGPPMPGLRPPSHPPRDPSPRHPPRASPPRPSAATSSSATLPITPCWPRHYACDSIAAAPLTGWMAFLARPGPRRLRDPPPRRLPRPAAGRPDREGPPRRIWLPRPRLPRL